MTVRIKQSTSAPPPDTELLTVSTLITLLGRKSRQYAYDLLNRDATFPRPVRTPGGQILWRRNEVMAWIDALPRAEFIGIDAVTRRNLRNRVKA